MDGIEHIPSGEFRKHIANMPDWIPEIGHYANNIAIVCNHVLDHPLKITDNIQLKGPIIEYFYFCDDRHGQNSESHFNMRHFGFVEDSRGKLWKFTLDEEYHLRPRVDNSTAMVYLENTYNLGEMPKKERLLI